MKEAVSRLSQPDTASYLSQAWLWSAPTCDAFASRALSPSLSLSVFSLRVSLSPGLSLLHFESALSFQLETRHQPPRSLGHARRRRHANRTIVTNSLGSTDCWGGPAFSPLGHSALSLCLPSSLRTQCTWITHGFQVAWPRISGKSTVAKSAARSLPTTVEAGTVLERRNSVMVAAFQSESATAD